MQNFENFLWLLTVPWMCVCMCVCMCMFGVTTMGRGGGGCAGAKSPDDAFYLFHPTDI